MAHAWVYPIEPRSGHLRHVSMGRDAHAPLEYDFISGYHIREAARRRAQSRVHARTASPTSSAGVARGLDIDSFAARSLLLGYHNDFFEEIAKLRAARRIWRGHAGALQSAASTLLMMRFHSQTAGVTLTAQQPLNNIVACRLPGPAPCSRTQSLHTNSR